LLLLTARIVGIENYSRFSLIIALATPDVPSFSPSPA